MDKHKTKDLNDGYLGTGSAMRKAIKKYGRESFSKKILHVFDNEAEMNDMEARLVTEEFCESDSNYNLAPGGAHSYIRKHSEESKAKMSEARKRFWDKEENRQKASQRMKDRWIANPLLAESLRSESFRRKRSEIMATLGKDPAYKATMSAAVSGEKNGMFGRKHSPESIAKMKANRKGKGTKSS